MAENKEKIKDVAEDVKEEIEEIKEEITEEITEEIEEAAEELKEAAEEVKSEVKEAAEDLKEAAEEVGEKAEEVVGDAKAEAEEKARAMKASTEANRQKKAERREAKAARKEANRVEEKKTTPNNLLLAILIFGVLIGMFVFVGCYNYFSKPASIEKYMEDNGLTEMYKEAPVSEYTTLKVRAEGNTIKMWFVIAEDAPEEELAQYKGEDGTEYLKQMGSYFLTSMKPETQGFGGTVKVKAKQGDEKINYVEMSYREAKKFMEEEQKKAEEEAEEAEDAADEAEDAAEEAEDAAEDAAE